MGLLFIQLNLSMLFSNIFICYYLKNIFIFRVTMTRRKKLNIRNRASSNEGIQYTSKNTYLTHVKVSVVVKICFGTILVEDVTLDP